MTYEYQKTKEEIERNNSHSERLVVYVVMALILAAILIAGLI